MSAHAHKKQTTVRISMLIAKKMKQLPKLKPDELIRNQKQICQSLDKLYKMIQISGEMALLQVQLTKLVLNFIYKPIKDAIKSNTVKQDCLNIYQYFFNRYFGHLLPDDLMFKKNTESQRKFQLHYGRSTDRIFQQFRDQSKFPPARSLSQPMDMAYQSWRIGAEEKEQIFLANIEILKSSSQNLDSNLARYLCALLNSSLGAVVIGVNNKYQIEGVNLDNKDLPKFKQRIEKIRSTCIFPPRSPSQKLSINFIKVDKYFGVEKTYEKETGDDQEQGTYVIKIFADTQTVGKAYFVVQNNKQYSIFQDPKKDVLAEKYYQIMHRKFKQKKRSQGVIIKNSYLQSMNFEETFSESTELSENLQLNQQKYGRQPQKFFKDHSIMILNGKQKEKFNEFLSKVDGDSFRYYEIYQKFNKTNCNRKILYMTHRMNAEDVISISKKIDEERKNIIVLKIKPQLTMLRQDNFPRAYEKLVDRYQSFFKKKLKVIWKRADLNSDHTYFLSFDNDEQAIFAFTVMEYSNFRTNFANPSKLAGSEVMTEQQIQKMLEEARNKEDIKKFKILQSK